MLRGVIAVHNAAYGNTRGGIGLLAGVILDALFVNNAAHAPPIAEPFPPANGHVHLAGNVNSAVVICFVNPLAYDFSPGPGSPLPQVGVSAVEAWIPAEDFGRLGPLGHAVLASRLDEAIRAIAPSP